MGDQHQSPAQSWKIHGMLTRFRKSLLYSRLRQYLPMQKLAFTDDRARIDSADVVRLDWPAGIPKPRVGLVQDYGPYPSWSHYARYLEKNAIPFEIYPIHAHDWIEKAAPLDIVVGFTSSASYHLEEMRSKFDILENQLHKTCFPSYHNTLLYEDKKLEAYLARIHDLPFVKTYVSHDLQDALHLAETLTYPVVSKIVPSSSSVGVQLIHNPRQARRIIRQAFSENGRASHVVYARQKNYVYFQDFVPGDGYDIRVTVVGRRVFGFFRKVLPGDFRASGMHQEEMRALPLEAMQLARAVNRAIPSPMLVVDLVHGLDGKYYINEYSPLCQMSTLHQLKVNGVGGAYVFDSDDACHFEPFNCWVQELALHEFFTSVVLPPLLSASAPA